jgi:hypothetical protein
MQSADRNQSTKTVAAQCEWLMGTHQLSQSGHIIALEFSVIIFDSCIVPDQLNGSQQGSSVNGLGWPRPKDQQFGATAALESPIQAATGLNRFLVGERVTMNEK